MPTKLTTSEFIERARQVHGDRYDYARTVYVNRKLKVIITCREHGDFEQRAADHTRGKGCLACGGKGALTTSEFITKARQVHGDRYEYDRTSYVRAITKVIITCPEHGDFEQCPSDHTRGIGCPSCGGCKPHTTAEFITRARNVHRSLYNYSKSVYVNKSTKLIITCPEHGDFKQTPNNHTQGVGCPSCANHGYQPNKTGYLYFLLDTETHSRIKIGISNRPDQRLRELRNATPFEFEPMEIIETYGEIAPQLEKLCHEALPSAGLTGFDGATEWMKYEGATVRQLIETCEFYRLLDTTAHTR